MTDPASGPRRGSASRKPFTPAGYLVVALGALVVLAICALVVRDGTVGWAEEAVFRSINDLPGWLYPILWPFQQFGNLLVALVVGLVVALVLRQWKVAVAVVAAVVLKLATEMAVKELVQRSRPGRSIGDIVMRGDVSAHGLSFVSGHAVITAAIAGILTPILPRRWKPLPWVIVALNAFARIYVGAHNPLDIVGGIALGVAIACVLDAVIVATRTRRDRQPALDPSHQDDDRHGETP
ncbi:MAG: phosphatase PAP2 family protein [Acidimicrobiia bacterium]